MKHKDPFFSVIIPTFNRAELLGKAIQSVIDQNFADWELIVVDDGSTDHTTKIVHASKDSRVRYQLVGHAERSSARNTGIELAKGRYICFLDDDDYYLPDFLQNFFDWYSSGDPNTILRTGFYMLHKDKKIRRTNFDPKVHPHPVNYAAENMCGVWTLSVPKQYLKKIKFPAEFPHWQDTHLILRLLDRFPFFQLDAYQYVYVIHKKMGSIIYNRPDALGRIRLNIAAIRDLYSSYPSIVQRFGYDIKNNQLAAKWSQHFVNALYYRKWRLACAILFSGLKDQNILFLKKIVAESTKMIKNKIGFN